MIKRLGFIFCLAVLLSSCTKVKHIPQLITLKSYSEEQESIEDYVHAQDNLFAQMLSDIESGKINEYSSKDDIVSAYGNPIYDREEEYEGAIVDKLLYRRQKEFFGSEKVYIYFGKKGELLSVRYIPRKSKGE